MKEKRRHKKPIGEDGPVRVTHIGEGEVKVEWRKIEYPDLKSAQEAEIAGAFVIALNKDRDASWSVEALEEHSFDFEMHRNKEKRYLELQEIVIPGKKRSPHTLQVNSLRSVGENIYHHFGH